ncbi:hypothetical protein D9M73_107120 [compost metagenome]
MEVQAFFAGKVRQRIQVVDRAAIDRARSADQQERRQPGGAIRPDERTQRGHIDPPCIIGGDAGERVGAKPRHFQRAGNAAVNFVGSIGNEARCLGHAALPHSHAACPRARDQQRDEIGLRRSGQEQAIGGLGKGENFPHPVADLPLDQDRHVVAPAQIGVKAAAQHFGQHANRGSGTLHPSHETGMQIAACIRKDRLHEGCVHARQIGGGYRQCFARHRADVRGGRSPHQFVREPFEMIDHVIEHPMPLRAQARPLCRIERCRRAARRAHGLETEARRLPTIGRDRNGGIEHHHSVASTAPSRAAA